MTAERVLLLACAAAIVRMAKAPGDPVDTARLVRLMRQVSPMPRDEPEQHTDQEAEPQAEP